MTCRVEKSNNPAWSYPLCTISDQDLLDAVKEACADCNEAAEDDANSEWHESCFAAVVVLTREIQRRALNLGPPR